MILLNKAKNYLMNGAMDFWQRNTSVAAIATGTYVADRWQYAKSGTMVHTLARDTDVPTLAQSGFTFPYSMLLTLTTAQVTITSTDYCNIQQKIEGQFFAPLAGRKITISFWVKFSVTGTFAVGVKNANADRSYVSTFTVNSANTWEKKSITITHDTTGTWNYTTGIGLQVNFTLVGGSTYQAPTLNTWLNGNYYSHSTVSNGAATVSSTFRMTGFQLEEGDEASNFERSGGFWNSEFLLCQRYYEKSPDYDQAPGHSSGYIQTYTNSNGAGFTFFTYKAPKRATPVVSSNGAIGSTVSYNGLNQVSFTIAGAATTWYQNYFSADAEL